MGKINILDKTVANKIAAGEVVERPASVIKELIENAIDAGAKKIQVNLEEGGQKLIEVIDDGIGMSGEDAKLAMERFATSKINSWEDLESINTFGFRGEALPSISAISRLTITTREHDSKVGYRVVCNGGEVEDPVEVGAPVGTRVTVRDIFYNTPARRKFLKKASSETAHIVGITQKLALVNDNIAFHLASNGRTLINFPSQMNLRERILTIWGLPLDYNSIFIEHESPSVRVSGYICPPDKLKSHRSYQTFFVNGRYIKNIMINQAVVEGFSPLLPAGKFPIALIFIDLSGEDVDINVHPNKMEVRFLRPGAIFKTVRDAIKKGLRDFGYTPFTPVMGDVNPLLQAPVYPAATHESQKSTTSGYLPSSVELPGFVVEPGYRTPPAGIQYTKTPETDLPVKREFRALAQIRKTYIIGLVGDEIWIVDQHTAHERINYEKLSRVGKNIVGSQKLMFPIMMELPPTLFNFLGDKKERFEEIGFEIEPFGGNSYLIKAVPYGFNKLEKKENLIEILEEVAEGEPYSNLTALYEHLRATIACKSSIKAGDTLNVEEMNSLVNELIRMDYSSFCPHGRPVVIKLSKEHVDRMFFRS
ncbi:MAG: DNA mismatch repair endonuclease MutL [Candidatus Eremiobacteraeota bacterium]|nr:DNA mismatch repair endonuclease MutL [Candidatus Eremiobacteraeota bacterium]